MKLIKTYLTNRRLYKRYILLERKQNRRITNLIIALDYMKDWTEFHSCMAIKVCEILEIRKSKAAYKLVKDIYIAGRDVAVNDELVKRIPL